MSTSARILVVRHGESTWNAQGRWQGQADPPLSTLGEAQATKAGAALDAFDEIVTSDLQRALTTARLIADALGHGPVGIDPRLRERHAGAWQGLTVHEVETQFPGYLEAGRRPPGFEPSQEAATRAMAGLVELAARNAGGTALAVSHGGILRALRKTLEVGADIGFANLAGQWFEIDGADVRPLDLVSLLDGDRLDGDRRDGDRPVPSTPL